MSIGYCEKHDLRWDMDKTDDCPDCEDEPVSSNKHTQDLERALAKSERALTAETQRRQAAEAVVIYVLEGDSHLEGATECAEKYRALYPKETAT